MSDRIFLFLLILLVPMIVHPQTAKQWYEQAQEQIQKGEREKAKESLEKALSADPNFVPAKIQLGFLNLWEGDLSVSYELFLSALELAPCDQMLWTDFAKLALVGGRLRKNKKKSQSFMRH